MPRVWMALTVLLRTNKLTNNETHFLTNQQTSVPVLDFRVREFRAEGCVQGVLIWAGVEQNYSLCIYSSYPLLAQLLFLLLLLYYSRA